MKEIWYSQMPRIQLYHGDGAQETGGKCLRKEADLVLDFPLVTSLLKSEGSIVRTKRTWDR